MTEAEELIERYGKPPSPLHTTTTPEFDLWVERLATDRCTAAGHTRHPSKPAGPCDECRRLARADGIMLAAPAETRPPRLGPMRWQWLVLTSIVCDVTPKEVPTFDAALLELDHFERVILPELRHRAEIDPDYVPLLARIEAAMPLRIRRRLVSEWEDVTP